MTLRDKLKSEFPGLYNEVFSQEGIRHCPYIFNYETQDAKPCKKLSPSELSCSDCWDREYVPTNTNGNSILDSGELTTFETGAVRSDKNADGSRKGRCDLLPLESVSKCLRVDPADYGDVGSPLDCIRRFQNSDDTNHLVLAVHALTGYPNVISAVLDVAVHYEEGAEKYGEDNWRKGLPVKNYISSMVRHYLKWLRGDTDEHHDRAFVWNILCCIWEHDFSPRAVDPEPVRILNKVEPKTEEPTVVVKYLCDRQKCETCDNGAYSDCKHTSDISHAANFQRIFTMTDPREEHYIEKETPYIAIGECPYGPFEALGNRYVKADDEGHADGRVTAYQIGTGQKIVFDPAFIVKKIRVKDFQNAVTVTAPSLLNAGTLFLDAHGLRLITAEADNENVIVIKLSDGSMGLEPLGRPVNPILSISYEEM